MNVVKIMFYLATGAAALLSYLAAKKSIFSPIKTEVFKAQIKVITDVMELIDALRVKEFIYKSGIEDNIYDTYESIAEQISVQCKKLKAGQHLEIMHHEDFREVVMTIEVKEDESLKVKALHNGSAERYVDWALKLLNLNDSVFLPRAISQEIESFRVKYGNLLDKCMVVYEKHAEILFINSATDEYHEITKLRFIDGCLGDIHELDEAKDCFNQIKTIRKTAQGYIKSEDIWNE